MKVAILDVEHGFCAYAVGRDGGVLLFDCGHGATIRPSTYLHGQGISRIRRFFVTNYDEDHISDLINVRRYLAIEILTRNPSLTSTQIRSLKTPPLSPAMKELLAMVDDYTGEVASDRFDPEGIRVSVFWNDYPLFSDTNNLSLLTFLEVGNFSFALGGDLERDGWVALLEHPQVRALLKNVDVFVASHHGRENGYCPEVFDHCNPSLIVMSDGPVTYSTQEMASTYARHATGSYFNNRGTSQWRKVVTTRKDGTIYWNL